MAQKPPKGRSRFTAPEPIVGPARPIHPLRGISLHQVLLDYKDERKAGIFPYSAFTRAATEIEWLPPGIEPDAAPLVPNMSVDEIQRFTGSLVLEVPAADLPIKSSHYLHKLTAADVDARHAAMTRILKRNGIKVEPDSTYRETIGQMVTACVFQANFSRRYDQQAKYLSRRKLPPTHPLHGLKLPLHITTSPTASKAPRGYPHSGFVMMNTQEQTALAYSWEIWSGLRDPHIERIPNNADIERLVRIHEMAHIKQGADIGVWGRTSDTQYRVECHADLITAESYKRFGASPAQLELNYASNTLLRGVAIPGRDDFSFFRTYWYPCALMSGRKGCDIWPLYRASAAMYELHLLGTSLYTQEPGSYNPALMNQLLRETFLRLQEHPPQKDDTRFTYKHLNDSFNRIAASHEQDQAHRQVVAAFNHMASAHQNYINTAKTSGQRRANLLSAFTRLWQSDRPLSPDVTLHLGLVLEAGALFRPSILDEFHGLPAGTLQPGTSQALVATKLGQPRP